MVVGLWGWGEAAGRASGTRVSTGMSGARVLDGIAKRAYEAVVDWEPGSRDDEPAVTLVEGLRTRQRLDA